MASCLRKMMFLILAVSTLPTSFSAVFKPTTRDELKKAVDECLKMSPLGECGKAGYKHGPIGEWDVSHIFDMTEMFYDKKFFNADISNWNLERVKTTKRMFFGAKSFHGDLSKWDVSSVKDMTEMFALAYIFNSDISKWHVGRVTTMKGMFRMDNIGKFSLKKTSFNVDISKWDTSRVNDMSYMFYSAKDFNHDLSEWDVGRVLIMTNMFELATSFSYKLCGVTWVSSTASKVKMFLGTSSGSIAKTQCTTTTTTTIATTTPTTTTTSNITTTTAPTTTKPAPKPTTSTKTATTTKATTVTEKKKIIPPPDWSGTVGAFVAILVVALGVFAAAIYVWYLVLKKENPEIKLLEVPSAALSTLVPPKDKYSTSADGEEQGEGEFDEAENKSVTASEEGKSPGDDLDLETKTETDDVIDGENPVGESETEAKTDGLETADLAPENIVPMTPLQQLQDIVNNSVHATPQEKQDLVDDL